MEFRKIINSYEIREIELKKEITEIGITSA